MKNIFNHRQAIALSAALTFLSSSAFAHVVLEQKTAEAGSYYKATLRVGHGCKGSATTSIQVMLPEGFRGAKPMPKPGWTIAAPKVKLAQPYQSHGKTVDEDVNTITWSGGPLPDAFYDEFVLFGKLPAKPGTIHFKVLQQCESGSNPWMEIPAPGAKAEFPAAALELTAPKASEHAGHRH
jgi:uncharacterized protein YcnI